MLEALAFTGVMLSRRHDLDSSVGSISHNATLDANS